MHCYEGSFTTLICYILFVNKMKRNLKLLDLIFSWSFFSLLVVVFSVVISLKFATVERMQISVVSQYMKHPALQWEQHDLWAFGKHV